MRRLLHGVILNLTLFALLAGNNLFAEGDQGAKSAQQDSVTALAARIDHHISARWQADKIEPAPLTDDAEFLRRTYLNIAGKIPRVSEVREFMKNPSPDKRRELVDRLLEQPAYIVNFTNLWRELLIPEAESDQQLRFGVPAFDAWLRQKLTEDVRYDELVRELITTQPPIGNQQRIPNPSGRITPTPIAFFAAKQNKAENLAAGISRSFLGVRLECAQCHDHPFAKWEQKDFWQFAAFFSADGEKTKVAIPDTKEFVEATFLAGEKYQPKSGVTVRQELARWLTSRENPYFARATVNRLWYHFFGRGIVDPVDDFDSENPPSHPKLLDELATNFADQDFDVKFLIRAITASKTYQLTSRQTHESQSEPQLFARMAVKGLTTEQLFDSLAEATGFFESNAARNSFAIDNNSERAKFRELFRNETGGPADTQSTILQALALMNGEFVETATSLDRSTTLAAVLESPFLDTKARVQTLYLAALAREPDAHELTHMVRYVESGGTKNDPKTAIGDVFWALLNSSEFILNH